MTEQHFGENGITRTANHIMGAVTVKQFLFGIQRDIGGDHRCRGNGRDDSNQNRVKRINKKRVMNTHGYIWFFGGKMKSANRPS